jgi:spermidine/putrescine transport system ATP-binding protein
VARAPRVERERRVAEALELVRLPQMGARRVWELSGGQQQRIALARALINRPAVLLLDEPLGALDLKLRKEMQFELKQVQSQVGITFIYVTHDQEEALTMSDRIAVMHGGAVQQVGDPMAIYEQPATYFVADFIGETNFLAAQVTAALNGSVQLTVADEQVRAHAHGRSLSSGQAVTLTVRPEKIALKPPNQGAEPALRGTVCGVVYVGTDTRYSVRLASGETLTARLQNVAGRGFGEFAIGDRVDISWAAQDTCVLTDGGPRPVEKAEVSQA